jgi:hypothetical protein
MLVRFSRLDDLEYSVTAERYRNNILDVSISQLHDDNWLMGIFNKTGLQPILHEVLFVICGNFLTIGWSIEISALQESQILHRLIITCFLI